MATMKPKTKRVQVCRDDDGWYVICPLASARPRKESGDWEQTDRNGVIREKRCNGSIAEILGLPKLKPGDGPVLVDITVTIARR